MTDHVSAAATLRANNASPLLSSGLSCHVVAEQVLGFLERKDILQCLAVECLKNHFHLEKYYCQEHGSKLESQVGRRQNHIARKEKQQGIADDVITNDTKKFKGECEDCVEEEFGFERCPDCTEFSPKEEVHGCGSCKQLGCESCCEFSACDLCAKWFCERNDCTPVGFCEFCDRTFCLECRPTLWCEKCSADLGCFDCAMEDSFFCGQCNYAFCSDCQDSFFCSRCEEFFCRQCKKSYYCSGCDERHCLAHGDPASCEDCANTVCLKMFQCAECETVTCSKCTGNKVYACPDCDKEICSCCHDFFKQCCCHGKGKFALKKAGDN